MLKLYKYQGAGNDFLIADNRDGHIAENDGVLTAVLSDGTRWSRPVSEICDRRYGVGADGLMLLESSGRYDFRMVYFNSDGSGGMMCGNGGRCIVAFASDMGIGHYDFEAADGFHTAMVQKDEGGVKTVRLKMKDISEYVRYSCLNGVDVPSDGWFLDTGTRHFVRMVSGLDSYDVTGEGRCIRYHASDLLPAGVNVNYVEPYEGGIMVRTYEKGVEDETYACGTGIAASAAAAWLDGSGVCQEDCSGRVSLNVMAKRDRLSVDFIPPVSPSGAFTDVWLTGPAVFVAEILLCDM